MRSLKWTEDLSVGLHTLDSQHKQLFAISQALHTAILNGQGEEALRETFDALQAYAERHFAEEEDFMRAINYPAITEHIAQHKQLHLRCRMLWDMNDRNQPVKPEGVAFFLTEWLSEHIAVYDKAIGEYAAKLD